MLGIFRAHLHQVTVFSSHVMHFEHFRKRGQLPVDRVFSGALIAPHRHEGEHPLPQSLRVEEGRIASDDTASLEFANSLEDRRRREANRPCDLGLCFTAIVLKKIQYSSVNIV